jgi:hypothetical protein
MPVFVTNSLGRIVKVQHLGAELTDLHTYTLISNLRSCRLHVDQLSVHFHPYPNLNLNDPGYVVLIEWNLRTCELPMDSGIRTVEIWMQSLIITLDCDRLFQLAFLVRKR